MNWAKFVGAKVRHIAIENIAHQVIDEQTKQALGVYGRNM